MQRRAGGASARARAAVDKAVPRPARGGHTRVGFENNLRDPDGAVAAEVPAGVTSFELDNEGPEVHEIVLLRKNDGVTESFYSDGTPMSVVGPDQVRLFDTTGAEID